MLKTPPRVMVSGISEAVVQGGGAATDISVVKILLPRCRASYSSAVRNGPRTGKGKGKRAVTVIRPGVIWGPGDTTILPRFAALLRRRMLVTTDGGRNLIGMSHVA